MTNLHGNFRDLKEAWDLDNHDRLVFDPEVLERYKQNPRYHCSDSGLYCNDPGEIFDITRIFTGRNKHDERRIAVYLIYLLDLPNSHHLHWLSYLKSESFYADSGSYEEGVEGQFTRHVEPITAVYWELKEINNITQHKPIFHKTRNDQLKTYAVNSYERFINYCLELNKLLLKNVNEDALASFFTQSELDAMGKKNTTLRRLEVFGSKFNCAEDMKRLVAVFKEVNDYRILKAHEFNQDMNDMDYIHQQNEITIRVYKVLKSLRKILLHLIKPEGYKPLIYIDEIIVEE